MQFLKRYMETQSDYPGVMHSICYNMLQGYNLSEVKNSTKRQTGCNH